MPREYVHQQQKPARWAWLRGPLLSSVVIILLAVSGCAQSSLGPEWRGPEQFAQVRNDGPWTFEGAPGRQVSSRHYTIYTTIKDRELQQRLLTVMEGALDQYQLIAPKIPLTDRPLPCYVFANKSQWADYTRANTGDDARIFLQINRGGYCVNDVFAAYFLGPNGTASVAAHEGWHQYVYRHFAGRMPPFLEEGIATMFENIEWVDDLPRWNLRINRNRAQALRKAVEHKTLFPLKKLVMTHAGDVVGQAGHRIDTYYAQNWAFALFMWEGDGGKYRPILSQMLSDIAANVDTTGEGLVSSSRLGWRPAHVPPLLEHYMGMKMDEIEDAYLRFVRKIAIDDYNQQWED